MSCLPMNFKKYKEFPVDHSVVLSGMLRKGPVSSSGDGISKSLTTKSRGENPLRLQPLLQPNKFQFRKKIMGFYEKHLGSSVSFAT